MSLQNLLPPWLVQPAALVAATALLSTIVLIGARVRRRSSDGCSRRNVTPRTRTTITTKDLQAFLHQVPTICKEEVAAGNKDKVAWMYDSGLYAACEKRVEKMKLQVPTCLEKMPVTPCTGSAEAV